MSRSCGCNLIVCFITEAFELFDSDNDGRVAASELGTAIRSLGHVVTDGELRHLYGRAGIDRELIRFCFICRYVPPHCFALTALFSLLSSA